MSRPLFVISLLIATQIGGGAFADPARLRSLSMDEQAKVSEAITMANPHPLTDINFPLALDSVIPQDVALQPIPPEAEKLVPDLRGQRALVVEELVAIVDPGSRKVVSVMQRMRRQENTGSGQ